ncbi:hypothetical protein D3C73_910210 [compost metagenome]
MTIEIQSHIHIFCTLARKHEYNGWGLLRNHGLPSFGCFLCRENIYGLFGFRAEKSGTVGKTFPSHLQGIGSISQMHAGAASERLSYFSLQIVQRKLRFCRQGHDLITSLGRTRIHLRRFLQNYMRIASPLPKRAYPRPQRIIVLIPQIKKPGIHIKGGILQHDMCIDLITVE